MAAEFSVGRYPTFTETVRVFPGDVTHRASWPGSLTSHRMGATMLTWG